MATVEGLSKDLANREKKETGVGKAGKDIKGLMDTPAIKKRFEEVLDAKAPQYMSSIINLVNGDTNLKRVDQMSVVASCMVAATLDLPVDKNLGYAWVIPYGSKAQFQIGYKGYVQLALRTGQYKSINVVEVHEGELTEWNPLTEKLEIEFNNKKSDVVIGYAGYFELVNGFKKTVYWSKEKIDNHARKFSKTYNSKDSVWKTDFDAMALKTVLRNMLSKWGILSIEMQTAYKTDMGSIQEEAIETGNIDENINYVDTDFSDTPFEEEN